MAGFRNPVQAPQLYPYESQAFLSLVLPTLVQTVQNRINYDKLFARFFESFRSYRPQHPTVQGNEGTIDNYKLD